MAKTKPKLGLVVLVIGCAATALVIQHQTEAKLRDDIQSLRERIAQLEADNANLSNRVARVKSGHSPRLPAPPMQATTSPATPPADDLQPTNLYVRFREHPPKLSAAQIETYLKANGSNAPSLLAAYRTTGDPALLQQAMQQHPNEPQVAFEAAFAKDLPPEQQRQWLDAFKQAAPDNAFANYLSAHNYFNAGQTDQAVQELIAASTKSQFQDYTLNRVQDDKELYLAAGYSLGEAERVSLSWLDMPQLGPLKQLGRDTVELAKAYSQSGDQTSAQAALQMATNLGRQCEDASAGAAYITRAVGMAIGKMALGTMDPTGPYGDAGQTIADRLSQLAQQKAEGKELFEQEEPLMQKLSDQDWINFADRRMLFGEKAALQWVVSKYGEQ